MSIQDVVNIEVINWTTVVVSFIAALFPTVPAIIVALRTHDTVNHKMDQLLALTRSAAMAEGALAEKAAESIRQGEHVDQDSAKTSGP